MNELVQLYDEQGQPIPGKGGTKDDAFIGTLHGASHVWIWRQQDNNVEILVQKRAPHKLTWPNFYDISAAGHIDLGEDPLTAAMRETQEEIGITPDRSDFRLIGVQRAYLTAQNGMIEHEFQFIYLLKLTDDPDFKLQRDEVESLAWISFDEFKEETAQNGTAKKYVPHSKAYWSAVIQGIEFELSRS